MGQTRLLVTLPAFLLTMLFVSSSLADPAPVARLPALPDRPAVSRVVASDAHVPSPSTAQDAPAQDCSIQYSLSSVSGTTPPGGMLNTTFTAQWAGGLCTWIVTVSSPGAAGISVNFDPAAGAVSPVNPTWQSAGTITVGPAASPGVYELAIHVDALVDEQPRPRRTFTYALTVVAPSTPTSTSTHT